jgi:hypothetical protein
MSIFMILFSGSTSSPHKLTDIVCRSSDAAEVNNRMDWGRSRFLFLEK